MHMATKKVTKKKRSNSNASKTKINLSSLISGNRVDLPLLIVVLMLVALGLVMVLSASSPSAIAESGNWYTYFRTQCLAAAIGLIAMVSLSKLNYDFYKKLYKAIYVLSVAILFLVLVPVIGSGANGARRWIYIGIGIQPSEITKIGLIIWVAGYYSDPNNKIQGMWKACIKPLIAVGIPILILLFVQNHLSAGIIIGTVTIIMIIMSGCKIRYLLSLAGGALGVAILAFPFLKDKLMSSFRSDRILAWLDPWANTSGTSYQTVQGLYAIGSGGLFGVGLGESTQKYLYIPEAHNDFIFAILAEELGFVGCAIVLTLFTILIIRGVLIALRAKDNFGSLIAIGITALIAIQVILNIAVVTNSMPNTGISLPFLSYGGSSLVILLASMGILMNISRSAKKI